MAMGYEYQCDACAIEWVLLSTRLAVGPKEWDPRELVCFTCQTFLIVPKWIDRYSWKHWYAKNRAQIESHEMLKNLAQRIERCLEENKGLSRLPFHLETLTCPTCQADQLWDLPFRSRPMRCPQCKQYSGHPVPGCCITNYRIDED